MQIVYLILCIMGTALPLAQFIPWLAEHGFDTPLFIQLAVATPISSFAWSDLAISGVVVAFFTLVEGRRIGMRHAWTSLFGLAVGVSLALPLFLLLRERHLAAVSPNKSLDRTRGR